MISTNLYLFFAFQAEERTDVHVERGRRGGGDKKTENGVFGVPSSQ